MKKRLVLLAFILQAGFLWAQQEAHYTQFMYNKQSLNPGFAGARRVASVMALYRNQWVGFNGKRNGSDSERTKPQKETRAH